MSSIASLLNKVVFPGGGGAPSGEDASFLQMEGSNRKLAYEVCERRTRAGRTNRKVVLYFHGNAENIFGIRTDMEHLSAYLKATVVYYDYAGYGLSSGRSTEAGTYSDALKMFDFVLTEYAGGDPSRIILVGRSLGSGPAVHTARQRPGFSSLVLISALTSAIQTKPALNFCFLKRYDMFRNIDDIQYIKQPILFFHGMKDQVVPASHSTELFNLAQNPRCQLCLFQNTGHNDLDSKKVFERIRSFVENQDQDQNE